jgi:ribulose-phosphate 3-epimerase
MVKIAPSILSIDFTDFPNQIKQLEESKAEWLHFDVMDGHFVDNLTFGPKILQDVKKMCSLFCDVHIMVSDPVRVAPWFQDADSITFHYETLNSIEEIQNLIKSIQKENKKAGISIKPNTDVAVLEPILPYVDLVLIMSVEPGHGGQKFMPSALDRIQYLSNYKKKNKASFLIQVDGGINAETGRLAKEAGAEVLVAGSYIFSGDIKEKIESLR